MGPYAGAQKNASGGLMPGAFGTPQTMSAASGMIPGGQTAGRFGQPAFGPFNAPMNLPGFQQIGGVPGATTLGAYQAQQPKVTGPVAPAPGVLPGSIIRTPMTMPGRR